MNFSPMLVLHICAGIFGVLSGAAALSFLKGSSRHALAGNIFFVSMLGLGLTGIYLAVVRNTPGNIFGGALTVYLVVTSWVTVRRGEKEVGKFDRGALITVLTIAAFSVTFGIQAAVSPTGMKFDYPPGPYFFLGSIALFAAAGDARLLWRHGNSSTQRIARHLWRMCFALFIGSASIFLARQHLFPAILRKTGVLILLSFAPLLLMIFWLIRIRFASARKRIQFATSGLSPSLPAN